MLILGHLVIGLIIGFILYEIFHARTIIVFCAIGSILPDIFDKLIGRVIFYSSLDNGRIFFHSLGIVLLFAIVGLLFWKYYRSFAFLGVGFGVLVHQVVDMIWKDPVTWYYPLLGPYPSDFASDYFGQAILAEITSVTEWIFFVALLVLAIVLYRYKTLHYPVLDPDPQMHLKKQKFYGGLLGVTLFVLAIAVIIITIWAPFFN